MMKAFFAILLIIAGIGALAQDSLRVYPTNWWVGMKHNDVQVMIHYRHIAEGATAVFLPPIPSICIPPLSRIRCMVIRP